VKPITYRPGALGALMDEYERAMRDLVQIVHPLTQVAYVALRDPDNPDPNCRSIQTVIEHVLAAGYRYIGYLRGTLEIPFTTPDYETGTPLDAGHELTTLVLTTAETFEGRWEMDYDTQMALKTTVRWGPVYDLEQLLEHAIVHVLRHRRQVERFLTETRFKGGRR